MISGVRSKMSIALNGDRDVRQTILGKGAISSGNGADAWHRTLSLLDGYYLLTQEILVGFNHFIQDHSKLGNPAGSVRIRTMEYPLCVQSTSSRS